MNTVMKLRGWEKSIKELIPPVWATCRLFPFLNNSLSRIMPFGLKANSICNRTTCCVQLIWDIKLPRTRLCMIIYIVHETQYVLSNLGNNCIVCIEWNF